MYEMFGFPDGPWRNDACMGYALMAMNRAEVDDETVRKVMLQMHYCFDDTSVIEMADALRDLFTVCETPDPTIRLRKAEKWRQWMMNEGKGRK